MCFLGACPLPGRSDGFEGRFGAAGAVHDGSLAVYGGRDSTLSLRLADLHVVTVCGDPSRWPAPGEEWSCAVCTMLNAAVHTECGVCGEPRG